MGFTLTKSGHAKAWCGILQSLAGVTALTVSTCVSAIPLTFADLVDPSPDVLLSNSQLTYSYLHDITDGNPGFLASDTITSASLVIDFRDDANDGQELVDIRIDLDNDGNTTDANELVANDFNPSAGTGEFTYVFTTPFSALMDGLLNGVLIDVQTNGSPNNPQYGDFFFEDSTLTVNVERGSSPPSQPSAPGPGPTILQIPEPTTLWLLGSTMLGLAGLSRRRLNRP